jgi:hypothetical protein
MKIQFTLLLLLGISFLLFPNMVQAVQVSPPVIEAYFKDGDHNFQFPIRIKNDEMFPVAVSVELVGTENGVPVTNGSKLRIDDAEYIEIVPGQEIVSAVYLSNEIKNFTNPALRIDFTPEISFGLSKIVKSVLIPIRDIAGVSNFFIQDFKVELLDDELKGNFIIGGNEGDSNLVGFYIVDLIFQGKSVYNYVEPVTVSPGEQKLLAFKVPDHAFSGFEEFTVQLRYFPVVGADAVVASTEIQQQVVKQKLLLPYAVIVFFGIMGLYSWSKRKK